MSKHTNGISLAAANEEMNKMPADQSVLLKKVGELHHYIKHDAEILHAIIKDLQQRNRELHLEITHLREQEELTQTRLNEKNTMEQGRHQLMEKLLEDINHYQQELEWYKRTYEKRTWLGLLRQKLNWK